MIWPAEAVWEAVSPLLPGFTVEVLPEIGSTNSELMRRARAGCMEPVLLVAEQQTAGRGRLGRGWASQAGESLTFSLGLPLAPADWSGLSTAPAWLQEVLPDVDAGSALLRITAPLVQTLLAFQTFGFAPFQARFNARDALRDRAVTLSDGTSGTAHGTSETGALLVHTARGMSAVTSSEVSVRPAP